MLRGLVTGPISTSADVPSHPGAEGPECAVGPRIAFFRGCASDGLLPGSARRLRQLLTASGCQVTIPAGQDCCGALAAHNHDPERQQVLHQRNLAAFAVADTQPDAIVVEAAGCGLELRDYPEAMASKVRDAVVLLGTLPLPPLAGLPLKVVVHDPCHARHGQGIVAQPRALLRRIPGLQLVEAEEAEVCCGSGGTYSLRHRALAEAMGRRKAARLVASGADVVVTANPGCLGQIADGLALVAPDLPIIPLTDLLWASWRLNR
jgi:glycolate oxidase iron-sulfur subunit